MLSRPVSSKSHKFDCCPAASLFCVAAVCAVSLGCVPSLDLPPRPSTASAAAGLRAPGCRPVVTGEPVVNELLVRPAGLDLDGDGKSSGRDEALELYLDASEPAHFRDVELWVDGQLRGRVVGEACVPPGSLVVLTGSTTGDVAVPPGTVSLHLDHPLKLQDGGGSLELRGLAGTVLCAGTWPDEPDAPPSSWARSEDGDRDAPFARHDTLAKTKGSAASIGRCLSGGPPCACLAGQGMTCGDMAP